MIGKGGERRRKKKRRPPESGDGNYNLEPAEEPVRGPSGDGTYRG